MLTGEKWLQFEFAAPVELDLMRQWLALSLSGLNDRFTLESCRWAKLALKDRY